MRHDNLFRTGFYLAVAILAVVATAVSTATNQEKPVYRSTGSEGTIVGTVSFAGKPPEPRRIDTSADPVCTTLSPDLTTDWVVVNDRKLANVFVYVRGENLDLYSFEPASPTVVLEHKGCRYLPHVFGMQTQQTLRVLNDDNTTHNTHPTPKNNREWNQSQPPGAIIEQRFPWPDLFIPIKDNQHPWEKAYVGVLSHPFFSVSATNGTYKISGVPPGHYTIVAWHERLGEQTLEIFLAGSEQKTVDFTFNASDH